jgi:ligand-binding sensor domain-containing protein/serine phosphatase RsbU (regulator of sigma subunit)
MLFMRILYIFFIFLAQNAVFAQIGTSFIQNYGRDAYKGEADVWCIAQSPSGIIYAGQSGLLEYDGVKWNKSVEKMFIRGIDFDSVGNIYLAASDDFGVVQGNGKQREFISLTSTLPDSAKKVSFVTNVLVNRNFVYFSGEDIIYVYEIAKNKIVEVWKSQVGFGRLVKANGAIYLGDDSKGLIMIEDTKQKLLPNADSLKEAGIISLYQYSQKELIVFTYEKGVFLYNSQTKLLTPLKTDADEWMLKNRLYAVTEFSDKAGEKMYVLGSNKDGIFILNSKGKLIQQINKSVGLLDNGISDLITDKHHNIWAATHKGITQIATSLPFTKFNHHQNIQSQVYDILNHENTLYIGTSTGVMYAERGNFKFIDKMPPTQSWGLLPFGRDVIVAGGNYGFFYLVNRQIRQIVDAEWACMAIGRSKKDTNIVFNAKYQGFEVLRFEHGQFKRLGHIKEFEKTINRSVLEDRNGNVWVGVPKEGFFRIEFADKITSESVKRAKVTQYTKGLGELLACYVISGTDKEPIFSTKNGLFKFNEQTESFELYNPYGFDFQNKKYKSLFPAYDSKGNVWAAKALTIARLTNSKKYELDSATLRPLLTNVFSFFEDKDSIYWFGGDDGLFRYDAKYKTPSSAIFPALIRLVRVSSYDSTLYEGSNNQQPREKPVLLYSQNSLVFEYAALSYYAEKENLYQYKLEGYDTQWSAWTSETRKEYTNLSEGKYIFKIRAKNYFKQYAKENSYEFSIKPPIYRTPLAYLLYVIFGAFVIFIAIKVYTRRLLEAKEKLEAIVIIRTQEIQAQNVELEQQKEEILVQAENLKQINEEMKTINEELNSTLDLANYQKKEIEKQHEDIKASINYAQRIQTAMLPFEERIKKSLTDFFILYKPRDIVSGDFYWFQDTSVASYSIDNKTQMQHDTAKVIIVAADCTGHGVPGAFMSMIGNELLNQIVNIHEITSPEKILQKLHLGILYALKQEQSKNHDGMDIAIVVLTKKLQNSGLFFTTLEYAGAMNPLYVVTQKNTEILPKTIAEKPLFQTENNCFFEIKATKTPIGGHYEMGETRTFENHTLDLTLRAENEVLTFYLSSDGYQDQFGGVKESKFMVKKFKQLLFDLHTKPMQEQKEELDNTFEKWRGNYRQIDDVLIVGIKI